MTQTTLASGRQARPRINPKGPSGSNARSRLSLINKLSCDSMWLLWPYHPALPLLQYDYDFILANHCQCANRSHRRKDCPLQSLRRCSTCNIAFTDNGSIASTCNICLDYQDARFNFLAHWVLDNHPDLKGQHHIQVPLLTL